MSIASIATSSTLSANSSTASGINFRAYSKLDLSEDQRKQIRSIVKNALESGSSADTLASQIDAVLTPSQQSQLAQANAQSSSSYSATSTTGTANAGLSATLQGPPPGPPPSGSPPGSSSGPAGGKTQQDPFASLNLTDSQQTDLAQIFASPQSNTALTPQSIADQINQVLTTSQQEKLSAEFNNGLNQSSAIEGSSSNVADQIAASNVLNAKQLQSELQ